MKLAKNNLCVLCKKEIPKGKGWFNKVYIPENNEGLPINDVESFINGNAFHWSCYLNWEKFNEFALQQFKISCDRAKKDHLRGVTFQNNLVMLSIEIFKPYNLYFDFSQTGSQLSLSMKSWEQISFCFDFCPGTFYPHWLHPFEEKVFRKIFPMLANLFPNRHIIAQKTDWSNTEYHSYVPLH